MGPSLTFHLAGGAGGMTYFLDHYRDGIESNWKDLGEPELTETLQRKLIDGIAAADGGQNFADLAAWRDRCLEQVLLALKDESS
jgi:carnitine 3-dehydrogenase